MVKLILASNSPRRKKILEDLGLKFEVMPSNYEEKLPDNIFSYDEKYKKIAFIFTGILILLHFFTNIGDIEDIQLYSFVYAFLRSMLSFLAVLEAVFIIEGIIKKKLKKK